jgi:hypothetical protein
MSDDWWFGLCYGLGIGAVVTDLVRGWSRK